MANRSFTLKRLADVRMVLDPKSHNEYGTIYTQEFLPHTFLNNHHKGSLPLTLSPTTETDENTGENTSSSSYSNNPVGQTMTDLHQRQPLIPSPATINVERWVDKEDIESFDDEDSGEDSGVSKKPEHIVKIEIPSPIRDEPRFPKEKWKTFIAALLMFINFLITTSSLALVHERVPDRDKYDPLPDIFLDLVPPKDWALDVSEILIMILVQISFLVLIFHKHRFIVFRRLFLMLSLLYLMRSITIYVTVLPVSSKTYYCSPKLNHTSSYEIIGRVLQLISGFGLSINGKHTYCGDYIYSGHTVILVLSYLLISEYSPKKFVPLHWIAWCVAAVGIFMVLLAHGHYTVDIIIAYYVTTRVFWIYHTLSNNPTFKNYSPNNYLARAWWFRGFQYFEKNVGGVVPRQYNWPLPWPRRFVSKHPNRNS